MKILIVEDEVGVSSLLRDMIEAISDHRVSGIARRLGDALGSIEAERPDVALIDIRLAGAETGFSVAAELREFNIPCLFVTATPPPFAMPELAMGCLSKPFHEEDVRLALERIEEILTGKAVHGQLDIYPTLGEENHS